MEEIWQLLSLSKHMPHPLMSQKVMEETPALNANQIVIISQNAHYKP